MDPKLHSDSNSSPRFHQVLRWPLATAEEPKMDYEDWIEIELQIAAVEVAAVLASLAPKDTLVVVAASSILAVVEVPFAVAYMLVVEIPFVAE